MTLRVIGAGLPRTGTTSLKSAIETLLEARCYHMFELHADLSQAALWWQAFEGDTDALVRVLDGYEAAIDWPASLFWRELTEMNPDAIVVHSHRADADTWWNSVDATVWATMRRPAINETFEQFNQMMRHKAGLGDDWDDRDVSIAMYDAVYDEVIATVPTDRLVVWQPSDGWPPLAHALGVPVPDQDFFHLNNTATFRERSGLDADGDAASDTESTGS